LDFYEFKFGLKESLAAIGNENSWSLEAIGNGNSWSLAATGKGKFMIIESHR
jgi:hypothetical protein